MTKPEIIAATIARRPGLTPEQYRSNLSRHKVSTAEIRAVLDAAKPAVALRAAPVPVLRER